MKIINNLITDEEVQVYIEKILKKSNCGSDIDIEEGRIYIHHYSEIDYAELQLSTDMEAYFGEDFEEGSYREVMDMRNRWYATALAVRWKFDKIFGCNCKQGFIEPYQFDDHYEMSTEDAKMYIFGAFLNDLGILIFDPFGRVDFRVIDDANQIQFKLSERDKMILNDDQIGHLKYSLTEYDIKYTFDGADVLNVDVTDLKRELKRYLHNTKSIKNND